MIPNQYIGGGRFSSPREYLERSGFDDTVYVPTPQKPPLGRYGFFSGCIMRWIPGEQVLEVEKTGKHPEYGTLIQWGM